MSAVDTLARWADELPGIAKALTQAGAGFQAETLMRGAESAVAFIRHMEQSRASAQAEFEAQLRDPAMSVVVRVHAGSVLHDESRRVIVRHTKASVWLASDFGSTGHRYSIRSGQPVGITTFYRYRIDWSTTTHATLLAAREAAK